MRTSMLCGSVLILFFAAGCEPARKSSAGFHLPDGDPGRGKAVFVAMNCNSCHRVAGIDFPDASEKPQTPVVLGGRVRYAKTDGEIVTSILDPSYKLASGYETKVIQAGGRSLMPDRTHAMTIRQMIDLVAFLQAHYEVEPPPPVH